MKSYSHFVKRIYRKKRVIHQVIHIIHRKCYKFRGLHSKIIEQKFCAYVIKFGHLRKMSKYPLTNQ